jgi:hypothetical protein
MTEKEILNKCFHSSSELWRNFISSEGSLNTLYYPSAAEDLRPFVFSKSENLNYMGLGTSISEYIEPNLFIFSDYFPYPNSTFFDKRNLYTDMNTSIYVEDMCELYPTENYHYSFYQEHASFDPSVATGKAIFFKARITSHKIKESYYKYAIYFFYENIGLIDQLFLSHRMPFSHWVWKRDGTGLGGGNTSLQFMYSVAWKSKTKFFFIWDHYLNDESIIITENSLNVNATAPQVIQPQLPAHFEISLEKKLTMQWHDHDLMNLYFRV